MTERLVLPDRRSWPFLIAAAVVWLGVTVLSGLAIPWLAGGALVAVAVAHRRGSTAPVVALAVLAFLGVIAAQPPPPPALPEGPVDLTVDVQALPRASRWSDSVLVAPRTVDGVAWNGPSGWLHGEVGEWSIGDRYQLRTTMRASASTWSAQAVQWQEVDAGAWSRAVSAARQRVDVVVAPSRSESRALLAGLLIGDTDDLGPIRLAEMQRSGLSHLVAVSGSNVALFLGTLFVLVGPIAWSARRRAVLGILGVAFFASLIGPDPSVIRASVMAALVLLAHAAGVRIAPWTVLGSAVAALLLASPELAGRLGFQLSVAATAGVMLCARMFEGVLPRWVGSVAGASIGAQIAVAPILMVAIGTVPLMAPVANLFAVPVAGLASVAGMAAVVTGWPPLATVASGLASLILAVAEVAAPMPQLGWAGLLAGVAVALAASWRRARPVVAAVVACIGLVAVLAPVASLPPSSLVALDVGQGDALLLHGADGTTVLVDGGPDPVTLLNGLRRWGVDSLDLVVVSHGHQDHYGGLPALLGSVPVGQLWIAATPDRSFEYGEFLESARRWTVVVEPELGSYSVGDISLEVLGPTRRYASPNNASLVLLATVAGRDVLLTGDIETVAQADIAVPAADVLKVPHHGAETSDATWLVASRAAIAIVTVGANEFGHPSESLLTELRSHGMEVLRTDEYGDVLVVLGG